MRLLSGELTWGVEGSTPLLVLILAAAAGTGILFAISIAAYFQRKNTQYLLISIAIGALWTRSIIGAGTVLGYVSMPMHHLVEHGLDLLIAIVVLYAVYAHGPGSIGSSSHER